MNTPKSSQDYPYTRVFQVDGAWYWQQIDSYGDATGYAVGPFENAVAAGHAARKVIVAVSQQDRST